MRGSRIFTLMMYLSAITFAALAQSDLSPQIKTSSDHATRKLSPDLREKAAAPSEQPIVVCVLITKGASLNNLMVRSAISRPIGEIQWITGEIYPANLRKLASISGVISVISTETYQPVEVPEDEGMRPKPKRLTTKEVRELVKKGGKELLRQKMEEVTAKTARPLGFGPRLASPGTNPEPLTVKTKSVHNVPAAWARGVTGKNVIVGVVDSGVDFGHPDLQGQQARATRGPYAGWPFAYSTMSGVNYVFDHTMTIGPNTYWNIVGATWYCHTLPVTGVLRSGGNACSATLKIDYGSDVGWSWPPVSLLFTWPDKSKSGRYRYTVHPDDNLRKAGQTLGLGYAYSDQEPAVVILSDETTSGVYDTVYVDVNFDQELRDEIPMRMGSELAGADVSNAAGNPGADGVWDLSAGMLTWISDGVNPPPGVAIIYPGQAVVPARGALIAFVGDEESHGTNCAGDIAAKGVITDPEGIGPINPLFAGAANKGGAGGSVLAGMAPSAKLAAIADGANLPFDAWTLCVLGFDGVAKNGDEAQIVNNSWGYSGVINDGWDATSRFVAYLNRTTAPNCTFLVSTGNGGHGFGTVTSPGGGTTLGVGASESYGTLTDFELVYPNQFTWGNVIPWSNRGPGTSGDLAPDIVAVGAWGTGANPLNDSEHVGFGNGQAAYALFGGTSMASPIAAGIAALVCQAYYDKNGRYPTWQEVRTFLLNGATDLGCDALTQGAGNLNADKSAKIAGGQAWRIEPSQWTPGSYRGARYPMFPSILFAGGSDATTFTLTNPAAASVTVDVSDAELALLPAGRTTFTLSLPAGNAPPVTTPTYVLNITPDINRLNADFVRAQVIFPYNAFDKNGDYQSENRWRVLFYDWTDLNHNGKLWTDTNGNGVVDKGEIDVVTDAVTGKRVCEYNRFTYGYPNGNYIEASIGRESFARRHDGVFFGVQRRYGTDAATLKVTIEYFKKRDWSWLTLTPTRVVIPARTSRTLTATLAVPSGTKPGVYEGEIRARDGATTTVIPVVVHVAAQSPTFQFGAASLSEAPGSRPYDNGHVFGGFDWNWRYEVGDWRLFYYDLPNGTASLGKMLIVDTQWKNTPTDIDTWIFGPVADTYSMLDPAFFGPYVTEEIGGSANTNTGSGVFRFNTATGGAREIVSAELRDGLNFVALHNVLNAGVEFAEAVVGRTYKIETQPFPVNKVGPSGYWNQTFLSDANIPEGIRAAAYGLSQPYTLTNQTARQDTSSSPPTASWVRSVNLQDCGLMEVSTFSNAPIDIDLYLYKDGGNGVWDGGNRDDVLIAGSAASGPSESVSVLTPANGRYWIAVHGWNVPGSGQPFDITIRIIQGRDLTPTGVPSGPITAGSAVSFRVNWSKSGPGRWEGLVVFGPTNAPKAIQVPVTITPQPVTAAKDWALY